MDTLHIQGITRGAGEKIYQDAGRAGGMDLHGMGVNEGQTAGSKNAMLWLIFLYTEKHGHEINNSANVLKSVNRKDELMWKNIFIHKHAHHIMNYEVPPENSLIKKYICRSPHGTNQHRHNV